MKLSVIGSNTIQEESLVLPLLHREVYQGTNKVKVVLGGGGKGLPMITKKFCKEEQLDYVELLPYFLLDSQAVFTNKYFFIRNKQLVDNADKILFIYNGDCQDVEYAIKYAQKLGKDITIVKIPK
jgi:predicted Rossmann-fold nucleotide-binding protein